jgi:hypothetical protein
VWNTCQTYTLWCRSWCALMQPMPGWSASPRDHLKLHSWQRAWPFLSRSYGHKIPIEIQKKTYGDLRSCRSSDETLEERLELCPQKRRRLLPCLREVLASRYSARTPFLRVCIEAFLKRFATRSQTRSSFAPRKTYTYDVVWCF